MRCSAITKAGESCKGTPLPNSAYCHAHDPTHAEQRRRYAHKGGRTAGKGRPSTELKRLQARFEELAEGVLNGEIERGVGAVAGQLLGGARACIRDVLAAREQEELVARMEAIEEQLAEQLAEQKDRKRYGS